MVSHVGCGLYLTWGSSSRGPHWVRGSLASLSGPRPGGGQCRDWSVGGCWTAAPRSPRLRVSGWVWDSSRSWGENSWQKMISHQTRVSSEPVLQLVTQTNRLGESLAILYIFDNLAVWQTLEWKGSEGDDLVKEDPVAPDIGARAEDSVSETLRSHPSDRQQTSPWEPVVVRLSHLPGQTKVGQLYDAAAAHQAVPAGHVSVDISDHIKDERTKLKKSSQIIVVDQLVTNFCWCRKVSPLATSCAMLVSVLLLTSSWSSLSLSSTRSRRASK